MGKEEKVLELPLASFSSDEAKEADSGSSPGLGFDNRAKAKRRMQSWPDSPRAENGARAGGVEVKVRILGVSECEDSESVRNPSESQLFVTTMNQDVRHADSPARRSSKECANAPKVSFVETLVKDDIDAAVEGMLCKENYIIKKLDKYLQHQDFLNARRKEMLHKRWVENVDCPLQQKIIDKFSSPREMEKKKRLEPDGYWRFRNTTVTLPPFRDPLLQAQQDRDEENRAILQCETGKLYTMKEFKEIEKAKWLAKLPQSSLARQNISPNEWLKIPAGYMESELRQKSRLRVRVNRNQISSDFRKIFYPSETNRKADISQEDTCEESSRTWTSFPKLNHEEMADAMRGLVQSDELPVPILRMTERITANDKVFLTSLKSVPRSPLLCSRRAS
ncbi:protein FAM228B-like [Phascolarctos cinereus]